MEILRNPAGTSGILRILQLLGSFGNPSESLKPSGILRDPSGSFGNHSNFLDPSGSFRNLGILWESFGSFEILRVPSKFFGFPGDPLGILWNPSRILWNPLGSFGNPSGSFRNPLRILQNPLGSPESFGSPSGIRIQTGVHLTDRENLSNALPGQLD